MHLKFLPLSVECTDGPPPDVESLPHPLCAPGFDGYHSNSWPRVDLWGTLPTGQRATVHVHGCFPYFYARPLEEDAEAVRAFSVDPNLLRSICKNTAAGLDEMLLLARGFAFAPKLLARARVVAYSLRGQRLLKGFAVHPCHHQHLFGIVLLGDGGD